MLEPISRILTPSSLTLARKEVDEDRPPELFDTLHPKHDVLFAFPFEHKTVTEEKLTPVVSLLNSKQKSKVRRFVDLGCGCGRPVLEAAKRGWKAYGFDIDSDSVEVANNLANIAVERNFVDSSNRPLFELGNFYPENFNRKETTEPENVGIELHLMKYEVARVNYEASGVNLEEVDLFFHFQMETLENILNFFSKFGGKGSVLAFASSSAVSGEDYSRIDLSNVSYETPKEVIKDGIHFYRHL